MRALPFIADRFLSNRGTPGNSNVAANPLVVAIVVGIGLALIYSFISRIICFFTWKNRAGYPVEWGDGPCACWSGTAALWNDLGPTPHAMCCRSKHWKDNWAKGWCVDMLDGDSCLFDAQCKSGYCSPGGTGDSVCQSKLPTGAVSSWNRGGAACISGTAALWNDRGDQPEERCCPTQKWTNNWAKAWCTELPIGSQCLFNAQCKTGNCDPEDTAESVCQEKKPNFASVPWWKWSQCKSGAAGLWNDRGSEPESRCCPSNRTINNWAKGWCADIPINGKCIFNDQCSTKTCRPELSPDGICVNTDFDKGCSEHNQCKSQWCHAGKCK